MTTAAKTPRSADGGRQAELRRAQKHLRKADPVIGRFIERRPDFDPHAWLEDLPPMDLFGSLLFQIAGQQLSVAATRRTLERVRSLFGGHLPSPQELLAVEPGDVRAAGFSWRKVNTIRDLAERFADGRLDVERLSKLPDDEFIAELTAVPGVGPWTAQGALLVALRREDVVLPGDLALRKAIRSAYHLDSLPSQEEVLEIAEKWRPFRSVATSYLFAAAYEPDDAQAT
jgi:DNA-3-methyladenine glycosylase II